MICWVHGAFSSGRCFNYLRPFVRDTEALVFEYSVKTPLEENIRALSKLIEANPVDAIVGHSLGGVIAATLVQRMGIPKGVAIASPLGGFVIGNLFPFSRVLTDTASYSPISREIASYQFDERFLSIIAQQGNSATDGVVPVASQLGARGSKYIYIDSNHFEVLVEPHVGELIQQHLA